MILFKLGNHVKRARAPEQIKSESEICFLREPWINPLHTEMLFQREVETWSQKQLKKDKVEMNRAKRSAEVSQDNERNSKPIN